MAKKKPIVSPLGQWAYPGEVTIIPSSNITMKGVNYPVLGIDDLGNSQMMMPGQDYTFPGDYVTEIPQMGKGGLAQWFAEEWTDVKTGKPCGRSGKEKGSRPYPACRPKKRVNETTPKTTSEMSSAEKAKFKREKTSGKRIDYNHKRRQDGGQTGWLDDEPEVNPKIGWNSGNRYSYDKKGNLIYTNLPFGLTYDAKNFINNALDTNTSWLGNPLNSYEIDFLKNAKNKANFDRYWEPAPEFQFQTQVDKLNPSVDELINVTQNIYPDQYAIDNSFSKASKSKIDLPASAFENDIKERYVIPDILKNSINKRFGTLPTTRDDSYSPNRIWTTKLKNDERSTVGARFATDGDNSKYAYVLTPNSKKTSDLSKEKINTKKETVENSLSSIDNKFYENLYLKYPDYIQYPGNYNNPEISLFGNIKNRLPNQMWNRAEQMRVEMLNNPEIKDWADLHNVNLSRSNEDSKQNLVIDRFAPKVPESVYANRLVKAGLPVSTPDYDYDSDDTYIVQDPSKFNLAGYFPIPKDYDEQNAKELIAKKLGIKPEQLNNKDYLIHYNQSPITEYTPGKKYGGWLNKYQNAGEVPFDVERMQGVDIRKKRSWLDKLKGVVHRGERAIGLDPYNERSDDFFEQLARRINTATGGKDWYKQPNDASGAGGLPTAMMETVMAPFSIPQLAATYGVTGKVQTPSQAMDIQNPVGAFLTDAVLDPTNLVGAGIAKNLGSGALRNMIRNRSRGTRPDFTPNVSNQLPDPPSELILNPNTGQFDAYYDSSRPYFDEWVRMMNNNATDLDVSNLFANNPIDVASSIDLRKLKKSKNLSGLTKDDVLKNASPKDKEVLSKMSESEFEQTVLKPTGEIAVYEPAINLGLGFNTNTRNLTLRDSIPMGADEYTDIFNSRLDRLNEIIAKNNKSGLEYSVKGLSPSGALTFNTPAQIEKLAPNTKVLNELKSRGLIDSKGNVDPIAQDYIDRWGIAGNRNISQGESTWMLDINPGQWRGEVEDIANAEYFKAIPGLNMRNTTASVFSDALPRRGTGTYNSINQYLKELDLGRVKPGFNSQSQSSSGLWQDAIKKGKAFGYFNNPTTVYGSMRTFAPLGIGAAAASQLPEQKNGGWLDTYQDGGENLPELNSKIDIANFYKNPLSEKYGIYQDPTDKGYKYYLKSAEEPNIPSKTFDFTNLGNIARRIDKKEITTPQPIKYNSKMIDYAADQDYLTALATEEFPIIPPSFKDVLSNIPKLETINTIPKPKALPNKQPAVNNAFTFDSNYWNSADVQTEVFNRQLKDNKWYGEFDKRGDNVLNRTDVKRNYDSEVFLQNLATPNSVVIDIGSALGNNNPKLAGVSVYELASNPKIKSKNIKVIATDIPSEVKGFEELKRRGNSVYPIDYAQVPETFNTPVRDILKAKNLENVKDVYLRAANSIDLLMNVQETSEHFKHISSTLKDKNVTYLYNNTILYKPAGSTKFKKLGNLNNSAFDHRSPSWKNNPNRNHYTLLPTNKTGGEISWLNKYK